MIKLFSRYISVGVINTGIHWLFFGLLVTLFRYDQAISNVVAFIIAVTFSFFANARYTFRTKATGKGYILFVSFMGLLSFVSGKISDHYNINPLITLIEFSAISLICGFIYSKFIVFRDAK